MPKHITVKFWLFLCTFSLLGLVGCAGNQPVASKAAAKTSEQQLKVGKKVHNLRLNTPRFSHATATDGEKLYVFAGYGKTGFLTDIEIIDPQTGQIDVLTDKVLPRKYFSAVWDGQHSIYLIGGISLIDDSVALEPRVEIFDTLTQQVSFAPPVEVPRHDSSAVYLDGRIYLFGGNEYSIANGFELIPSTLATSYDIARQQWLPVADMPTAKSTNVFVKEGKIYALGGFSYMNPLAVFEQYDPTSNSWQILANAPQPLAAHSLALHGQKLWVFGNDEQLDLTYTYDFAQHKWHRTDIGYLPSNQNTATLLGDIIYVIGGTAGKGQAFLNYIQQFPQ